MVVEKLPVVYRERQDVRKFMDDYVLWESESLLCNMASFQQSMTMAVTRQIQRIVIISWRRSWKQALAEEAEASKVASS